MGGNERIDELHTLTQKINGAYSKYSRRGINKTAEGRALMQFKNWLPDVVKKFLDGTLGKGDKDA